MTDATFPSVQRVAGASALDSSSASVASEATTPARARLSLTSEVMRFLGAALLCASASTFMLQHWQHGSSTTRYLCLLAHTTLLAFAGFVCGLRVRENRAARTFFGLVLASVPVHFAVLGGVLRSAFPLDAASGPRDLWSVSSPWLGLALPAVGLLVVVPLARLACTALCRPHARTLTRAALLMNALVLLPVRAPLAAALVCGAMLCALLVLDARLARLDYAIRTAGARFARALLFAPIAVVIGRSLLFYQPTIFAYGAFACCVGLALFFFAPRAFGDTAFCTSVRTVAAVGAAIGTALMFEPLSSASFLVRGLGLPVLLLPSAALLGGLSFFDEGAGPWYRRVAGLFAAITLSLNTLWCWDFEVCTAAAAVALVVGMLVLLSGVYVGQTLLFLSGAVSALLGFSQLMAAAIELESLRNWGSLSLIGAALIFGAALVERHGDRLVRYGRLLRARLAAW